MSRMQENAFYPKGKTTTNCQISSKQPQHDLANVLPKDARKLRKILDITLIFGVFLGALVGGTLLTLPGGTLLTLPGGILL